jgi:hypothetical protein
MDWFRSLFGFAEGEYEVTRRQFELEGARLLSRTNGRSFGVGSLELVSLQTLRSRVRGGSGLEGRLKASIVLGDVRAMHDQPEFEGALFQVASQFNLLEMVGPNLSPEDGVTRYQFDRTQGPACAMAAGAATVYRNYFAPVDGGLGQTAQRQIDGLLEVGKRLGAALGTPVENLWQMRNGYALCTEAGLEGIDRHLRSLAPRLLDELRACLSIGIHRGVEVTSTTRRPPPVVSQAFCSALPVAYSRLSRQAWAAFACLILDAAYEATVWAAVESGRAGGSNVVLLTRLGGGAFGNDDAWIDDAMRRALSLAAEFDLDVRLVSYGAPSPELMNLAAAHA